MRDIAKDKEMCESASKGPIHADVEKWPGNANLQWWVSDFGINDGIGCFVRQEDAIFAAEAFEALPYWIAQYEAELELRKTCQHAYAEVEGMLQAAQARISELESLPHPNNRPDVATLPWYREECDWCGEDGYCQRVSKADGMPGDKCASCLRKEAVKP